MGTAISGRRDVVGAVVLAVAVGVLLTGCGGQQAEAASSPGDGSTPVTTSSTTPAASTSAEATSSAPKATTTRPKATRTSPKATANPGDVVLEKGETLSVTSIDLAALTAVATRTEMMSGTTYCERKKLSADHEECMREWITVPDAAGPQTVKLSPGTKFYLDFVAPKCQAVEETCEVSGKEFVAALKAEEGEMLAKAVTTKGEITAIAKVYHP